MNGVSRLKYLPQLDRTELLNPELRSTLPAKGEKVSQILSCYLQEAQNLSSPGSDVSLAFFFSNSHAWRNLRLEKLRKLCEAPTVIVFPLQQDSVKYILCEGNFWSNRGSDPVIIRASTAVERVLHSEADTSWKPEFQDYLLFQRLAQEKYAPYVHMLVKADPQSKRALIPWNLAEACFDSSCLTSRIR